MFHAELQTEGAGTCGLGHDSPELSPFGDLRPLPKQLRGTRADPPPSMIDPQPPSHTEPRPENVDVHRKAVALEALCSRFAPTVRKHCSGDRTAKEYVKRCAAYFHDCRSFLPRSDPLYNIAHAFNSNVGLNLGTVEVNGIPYYPINEEETIGPRRWKLEQIGTKESMDTSQDGAFLWCSRLASKATLMQLLVNRVSVPIKQGELGKPIGVDVGGGVGPYYQQNQHVGVDYMNGQVQLESVESPMFLLDPGEADTQKTSALGLSLKIATFAVNSQNNAAPEIVPLLNC
ncbi:hypothetical protein NECAME_17008 [Necator americanus]|uniref:Uncharacterized protein n=1 Tax=Necator americanus TaxID=51031 RepID=W2TUS2_NECAM|nr:hypothetical protein NECAME_17008 [Necator americanus]ETN84777.1 hypothetical protein NECAME_17008 [Necator americanus]